MGFHLWRPSCCTASHLWPCLLLGGSADSTICCQCRFLTASASWAAPLANVKKNESARKTDLLPVWKLKVQQNKYRLKKKNWQNVDQKILLLGDLFLHLHHATTTDLVSASVCRATQTALGDCVIWWAFSRVIRPSDERSGSCYSEPKQSHKPKCTKTDGRACKVEDSQFRCNWIVEIWFVL